MGERARAVDERHAGAHASVGLSDTCSGHAVRHVAGDRGDDLPGAGGGDFSTSSEFLACKGTLYLLGSDRPLCVSRAAVHSDHRLHLRGRQARWPGGRTTAVSTRRCSLALDEAALICPVPLPSMTADSGGRGIQVMVAVQSPSQLYETWGQRGGETIYNNSNAKLIFGGLAHGQDLDDLSKVCGERDDITRSQTSGTAATIPLQHRFGECRCSRHTRFAKSLTVRHCCCIATCRR